MSPTQSKSENPPNTTISTAGFRLGEDHMSDASDSDQSDGSTRRTISLSAGNNAAAGQQMSKNKKRKARKEVGALTEELNDLLGAAFQAPTASDDKPEAANEDASAVAEVAMIDEPSIPTGKKMSRRTRANLKRVEARKALRATGDGMDTTATTTSSVLAKQPSHKAGISKKKSAAEKRKEKKKRQQDLKSKAAKWAALSTAEGGDRMEVE